MANPEPPMPPDKHDAPYTVYRGIKDIDERLSRLSVELTQFAERTYRIASIPYPTERKEPTLEAPDNQRRDPDLSRYARAAGHQPSWFYQFEPLLDANIASLNLVIEQCKVLKREQQLLNKDPAYIENWLDPAQAKARRGVEAKLAQFSGMVLTLATLCENYSRDLAVTMPPLATTDGDDSSQ